MRDSRKKLRHPRLTVKVTALLCVFVIVMYAAAKPAHAATDKYLDASDNHTKVGLNTAVPVEVDGPPDLSRDGWVNLDGGAKGYAKNGRLVTGWFDLGASKYYFDESGRMLTGWQDLEVSGKLMHYYFNPASGNLVRGTWFKIGGTTYYFRPSGNLATGWATIPDNGVDKKYYLDGSGQLLTGWQDIEVSGKLMHYYFRPSGAMATGWATIDGEKFFFRPSGNMATGFADVPEDAYKRYFDESGRMLVGWQVIGSNTYYFRPSGAMQTGEATIGGKVYRFEDDGKLSTQNAEVRVLSNSVGIGKEAVFTCEANGFGGKELVFQWQRSIDAIDWEDIPEANDAGYSVVASAETSQYQYRCVVSAGNDAIVYSESAALVIADDIPNIMVSAHVKYLGWLGYVDAGNVAGTTGQSRQLEAIKVKLDQGYDQDALRYRVHNRRAGWSAWCSSDEVAGVVGEDLRAEAIEMTLDGVLAESYDIYYRVHVTDVGWIGWAKNGETAGSTGLKKSIEAVQATIVRKGEGFDVGSAHELKKPPLSYCAHVQNLGWQPTVKEGATAGTTGQELQLEAIKMDLPDIYGAGSAISYRTHSSDIGWQNWVTCGQVSGTTGQDKQAECIQIVLTGYVAGFFDVYYRVHVQDYGWLGWAKNGEMAGTTSGGRRIEAFEAVLVLKGSDFDAGGVSYIDLKSEEPSSTIGEQIIEIARTQLGVRYVYGGTTPGVGLDCSGLTQYCYSQVGISIPRTSGDQKARGNVVPLSEARVGDILWKSGHVALYLGGDQYLHAPRTGDVVKISNGIGTFTCAVQYY